jgi:hypothetical protein
MINGACGLEWKSSEDHVEGRTQRGLQLQMGTEGVTTELVFMSSHLHNCY